MSYENWNPYNDVECVEAYIEHVNDWYTEYCEDHGLDPKEWSSQTHYIEDHKDGFEEFSYTYWEEYMDSVEERTWEERNEK